MTETLLVTGASGKLGRHTVALLLEKGVAPQNIIATTREPSKLADFASQGVVVRRADFDAPDSLVEAFSGADRLALISTDALDVPGKRLAQQTAAVAAAKAAGVSHIYYTSMPNPVPDSPITFAGDHAGTEEAIVASGMTYTILRNSWYQENLAMSLPQAFATGQWFTSAGEGRTAHISHADAANALASAMLSGEVANQTFTLTGPEALTNAEIAALASEAAGKPIEVVNLTDDQLAEGMKAAGVPNFMVPVLIGFDANTRQGFTDLVTDDVEKLTGTKPRTIEAYLNENAAVLAG
ncbi:NAD(P)H dehydrogenase (quinone) [Poseidonocella pacifica]|uniref:NAD(P)H dehydrogenase (Quinone) n=1 Tax=Poseidonocella pacifica TaxID=871651 RepID=A0A1I0YRG1_9RHOB|nr:SDR family oxidoreductase [Poseidonocella pacifica]SFB15965.1 NAD(P)H dehydrogenase (quinone) [Poseidonocella pacifica]